VEITTAILCDFAQVREGLLFISSGGISRVFHPPDQPFPRPLGFSLALTIEIGPDELKKAHEVRVIVKQNATTIKMGQAVGAFQTSPAINMESGESLTAPIVIPLGLISVAGYGAYDVHISLDDGASRILTFYVKRPPPGMVVPKVHLGGPPPTRPNRDARRHPEGRTPRPRPPR
jgi:hypothetical protein